MGGQGRSFSFKISFSPIYIKKEVEQSAMTAEGNVSQEVTDGSKPPSFLSERKSACRPGKLKVWKLILFDSLIHFKHRLQNGRLKDFTLAAEDIQFRKVKNTKVE